MGKAGKREEMVETDRVREFCVRRLCARNFILCIRKSMREFCGYRGRQVVWKRCVWESCVWESCLWEGCVWASCVWERVCVCVCARVSRGWKRCVWESCVREGHCGGQLCVRELCAWVAWRWWKRDCVKKLCFRALYVKELCVKLVAWVAKDSCAKTIESGLGNSLSWLQKSAKALLQRLLPSWKVTVRRRCLRQAKGRFSARASKQPLPT